MKLSNLNTTITPANIDPTYLTNLVKEITVGVDTNTITFDNLDGNTDEGYILECEINNTSGSSKNINLYCNNDLTATNYYRNMLRGAGNSSIVTGSTADSFIAHVLAGSNTLTRSSITPKFVVQSQESCVINGDSTNSSSGVGTVIKITPPTNITSLDIKCEDATNIFGVGSKFKLYKKKLNPALVLSNRYLSNLVEEIRVSADCSSVTFSNLDSTLDGDYIIDINGIAANLTTSAMSIFINDDETVNNYMSNCLHADSSNTSISSTNVTNRMDGVPFRQGGVSQGTIKLSCIAGTVLSETTEISYQNSSTTYYGIRRGRKISSTTSINKVKLAVDTANLIKAGSVFRLYKTNSGALRPGPSFSAHKNGVDQTGLATNWSQSKVTFTTEEWDSHNCYDAANSRFTPTTAGLYQVNISCKFIAGADQKQIDVILCKSGNTYKSTSKGTSGTATEQTVSLSTLANMNGSTDYLEVYTSSSDTVSRTIKGPSNETYFQAVKVG